MGLLSRHYLVTLNLAMSRRHPGPCRAAGPFLEGQSRRSQWVTDLPRDTVRRGSYSQQQVPSFLHPASPLGLQGLVQSGNWKTTMGLGPLSSAWHQGAGGDCYTKARACLLKKDPNPGSLVPQRQNDCKPQSCMFIPQGISNSEREALLRETSWWSFDSAKELNWASRRGGERKEEFPVLPE